jgi:O-antigen/teichoic acid export membrane protein
VRNIKSRLATGSLWISGARGATTLLTFLTTIILARILVPADFGLVTLASTMLAILASLTNLSTASALVHLRDPTEDHYHTAWTLGVARGLCIAAVFCLIAWPSSRLYAEPRLDNIMYAFAFSVLVAGFTNPRLIIMKKKLIFWQVFVLQVANHVVLAMVSIAWALVFDNYWAIVLGTVAGQVTSTGLSYLLFPYRPRVSWKHVRELLSFSVWLTLGQAINALNFRFDHLLIGGFLGRAALGHYGVGTNLAVAPSREAVLPLTQTLFPAFSAVSDNLERLRRGYQRSQSVVMAIAFPAGIGFALIADPFVRLAMGDKWAPAIPVMQVMAAGYALTTLGSLSSPLALAVGATRLLFRRSLQIFLLRVPSVMLGLYVGGLMGLVYASNLVGIVGILVNMRMVRSLIGLPIRAQMRANLRSLAAGMVMAAIVLALQQIRPPDFDDAALAITLGISVAAGTAAYLLASWVLWIAAGRPSGPEAEALQLVQKLIGQLRAWREIGALRSR